MEAEFNACEWLVDRHVEQGHGDRVAIRSTDRTLTYDDLQMEVTAAAAALRALGVRPEERVAMAMLDSVEFVSIFLGAMRIGAIPLPMNPLLPVRDLGVIVADSRARVLVMSAERMDEGVVDIPAAPDLVHIVSTGEGGTITWHEFMALPAHAAGPPDGTVYLSTEESPGFWLCTSGSTGRPKLAMHRHGDIRTTCDTYARHVLAIGPDDVCYSVGPMFHAYGLGNSLTFPFAVGASTVLVPTRPPTPHLVADTVTAHAATLFFCIPTFYAALNASNLPDDTFASVRLGVSAAEPLPDETAARFAERFGVTIHDGIGSTEMLHIYLSGGAPVPGYEIRLVDGDDGDVADDEPGQLIVRGDSAAIGYWCRAEQSRSTFRGHWTYTGDLWVRDGDGFHRYMGRVDDMLRVGGEWVSPAEVEAALIEHAAVREAAVVGERDDAGVLRPIAFVIAEDGASPDAEVLTAFCRERLAGYKRPKRYEFVDDLPKTATGKIQRFKLRT